MIPLALAFLWAGAADPAATLSRVLAKAREDLKRIPNYTCVQTVTREFFTPVAPVKRSCEVLLEAKKQPTLDMKLRASHTDRIRLEVAMTGVRELHAWVGATRFDERPIDEFVREGPVGTGMFGSFLAAVCEQDVRRFRFERELTVDGHDRLEFSFDVPHKDSHYKVKVYESWVITAYRGTIEVDPATDDVTRIQVRTAVLPPAAGTCQTTTVLDLARTAMGPLATVARQRFVASTGHEAVNTMRFARCREYRGESTIRYEGDAAPTAEGGKTAKEERQSIPAGMPFSMELAEAIDPAVAAAGDPFVGRLREALKDLRGKTLAPRGARVDGRLLRVQQYFSPRAETIVVIQPLSVEVRGAPVALSARQDLSKMMAAKKRFEILLPFEWEEAAALLRFEGRGEVVPKGFVTLWRTSRAD
jgi:hypothetical protein